MKIGQTYYILLTTKQKLDPDKLMALAEGRAHIAYNGQKGKNKGKTATKPTKAPQGANGEATGGNE